MQTNPKDPKKSPIPANRDTRLSKARKSAPKTKNGTKSVSFKNGCPDGCRRHEFQLRPSGGLSNFSKIGTEPTAVSFCCRGNSSTIPIPMISRELLKQPQVPLFIHQDEIYRYEHYMESHRQQFRDAKKKADRATDSEEQKEQILVPVPKAKNCQICRIKIENQMEYERHIVSVDHRLALKKSLGQQYIIEQSQAFEKGKQIETQIKWQQWQTKQICNILKDAKHTLKSLFIHKK